jgi:hypothetical protein
LLIRFDDSTVASVDDSHALTHFPVDSIDNAHGEVIRTFYEENVRDVNGVADFVRGKFVWRKDADLLAYRRGPFRKLFLRSLKFMPRFFPKFACM